MHPTATLRVGPPADGGERGHDASGVLRRGPSTVAVAGAIIVAFGLVFLAQSLFLPPAPFGGIDNPGAWSPPRDRAELLVAKMDGHAFAQIADDPLMQRTVEAYHGDRGHAAYRASRPLTGWIYFLASAGGQRPLLAPAILVITALAAGGLVLATALLGQTMGTTVRGLWMVVAMPALVAALAYPGIAEPLAFIVTLGGCSAWVSRRDGWAVVLFVAAALAREQMLLVPLGIGLDHLVRTRSLRRVLPLAAPPAIYLAWVAVVRSRIGVYPSGSSPMGGFLVGLRQVLPFWRFAEWACAALLLAATVILARYGTSWMRIVLGLHLTLLAFANHQVWESWLAFGRVGGLIPLLALVAWSLGADRRHRTSPGGHAGVAVAAATVPSRIAAPVDQRARAGP